MTVQMERDYKTIGAIWHMLRDFGDITNTIKDDDRWVSLIDLVETSGRAYPEHRGLFSKALAIIETRAAGPEAKHYKF